MNLKPQTSPSRT